MAQAREWLTLSECAQQVGMSNSALRRNIENGTIPVRALRISPQTTRVHRTDWCTWLAANTINAEVHSGSA